MSSEKRFATRHLLPMEMLMFWHLGCLGFAGSMPGSTIYHAISVVGPNLVWTVTMAGVAIVGLTTSATEWFAGRCWDNAALRKSLIVRKWSALFCGIAWAFCFYTMVLPTGWKLPYLMMASIPMVMCSAWSWWENYRTEYVLDPTVRTSRLEQHLAARRSHW